MLRSLLCTAVLAACAMSASAADVTLNGTAHAGCTVIREEINDANGSLNVYCPDVSPISASPIGATVYGWTVYITDGLAANSGYNCSVSHLRTFGGVDTYTFDCESTG